MNINFLKNLVLISLVFLTFSCGEEEETTTHKQPIVKVFDNYLYAEELYSIVPDNSNAEDSINIVQTYINNWIQDQLMLNKAEEYLKNKKDEIDKKTEDFRNSLIIHEFKKEIINKNIDSNVNAQKIAEYYDTHKQDFKLNTAIIKGFFVKLPKKQGTINEFKTLVNDIIDLDKITNFVKTKNGFIENYTTEWVIFSEKILKTPKIIENEKFFLSRNNKFETEDDLFYYYMVISEYKVIGEIAPIEYVKDKIISILTQRESSIILNKYKQDIYDKAIKKGDIEYF